jgi:DNA-3-methyladenine glycosylase
MFAGPGTCYVYLCYGMHWLLNFVVREVDFPAAVLIRGSLEVSGPGRLTKALGLKGRHNGLTATKDNGIWVERGFCAIEHSSIHVGPRVGIAYAGSPWVEAPLRWQWKPQGQVCTKNPRALGNVGHDL